MDATSILTEVGEAIHHAGLDAVMIGNAAAALQGAPVTTLDIDFAVKNSDSLVPKLATMAAELEGEFKNYGTFFSIQNPDREIYLDFISNVIGVESFEKLKENSTEVCFNGLYSIKVASISDIIASKRAAGNQKDLAVLPILEKTLKVKNGQSLQQNQETLSVTQKDFEKVVNSLEMDIVMPIKFNWRPESLKELLNISKQYAAGTFEMDPKEYAVKVKQLIEQSKQGLEDSGFKFFADRLSLLERKLANGYKKSISNHRGISL